MLAEAVTDKSQVIAALRQASAATGSDFHYLLGTAMRESGLKTHAQSSTSSAQGLFQFVGQTWLGLVKEHGAKYGLGAQAACIASDGDGHFRVADPAQREAILALRKDARVASLMAGEFSNRTKSVLESTLGRDVCGGELYAAHFLGPQAACKLIRMNAADPDAKAAQAFPQAAGANKTVFYHADGSPKTVREVYNWALNQPNGGETLAASKPAPQRFNTMPMPADNGLLDQLMAWTPSRPSFSALADDDEASLPVRPFMLTPGVMDILSQVLPSHGPSQG